MMRHLFSAAAFLSTFLFVVATLFWIGIFPINPRDHHLSITNNFHISIWSGSPSPFGGRIVFFNDEEYGPYRGSIIELSDSKGKTVSSIEKASWGDDYGIYYRYFHWIDTKMTLWTLMVSLVYPMILFGIIPMAWVGLRWWQSRSIQKSSSDRTVAELE